MTPCISWLSYLIHLNHPKLAEAESPHPGEASTLGHRVEGEEGGGQAAKGAARDAKASTKGGSHQDGSTGHHDCFNMFQY